MREPRIETPEPACADEGEAATELQRLLQTLWLQHRLDFRDYALPSLRRRVRNAVRAEGLEAVEDLRRRVLADPACAERLLPQLAVSVTSMFRDPAFFRELRARVLPALRGLAKVQVWHAGCATGEEAYSLAILLREEGLLARAELLGTDLNPEALARAGRGELPLERMRDYTRNYQQAGGGEEFSSYYTTRGDAAALLPGLRRRLRFARHNLASDPAPGSFDLVLCRNVLFYFNARLQERAQRLLAGSLRPGGFLGLGHKESLAPAQQAALGLEPLGAGAPLYRRR